MSTVAPSSCSRSWIAIDAGARSASLGERLRLLADHLAEHVGLEVAFVAARCEQPSDRPRDGADARPRGRKASARLPEIVEDVVAGSLVLLDQLGQRLDGLARHPAGSVRSILAELRDPVFE